MASSICFFALLIILSASVVHSQRRVYPLIIYGRAPNGVQYNDQPAANEQAISPGSTFVKTSASPKSCRLHSDCYSLREPDEWCPMPATDHFYDKGCFCDASRGQCSIERQGPNGSEHADCTDKALSKCVPGAGVQFSESVDDAVAHAKSEDHASKRVYVKTSAASTSCKTHEDCYTMREPDEWCPMPKGDKYYEKGCFCDSHSSKCVIERQTTIGREYSDCANKSTSKCRPPLDVQFSDIQSQDSKKAYGKKVPWMTVSPKSQYVSTSGQIKYCFQQSDCYMMREPNEWCPLPSHDRYYEKGCFCDFARNVCAIEREVPGGSEYTECMEKTVSSCSHV